MRPNTQHITKALLVMALLSIFSFALAQTPVSNILDLWNVRNNLSGSYIQTGNIYLSETKPAHLNDWVPNTYYAVGVAVKHPTDEFAYGCKTANTDATFIPANWTKMWEASKGWEPIGNATTPFTGIYDGGGRKLYNLYINRKGTPTADNVYPSNGEDNIGLFGFVSAGTAKNAEIKNVNLNTLQVLGRRGTGSLVGKVFLPDTAGKTVIISNCSAYGDAYVRGLGATGGLVGANNSDRKQRVPIIRYCWTNATVTSTHPTNIAANPNDYYGSPRKFNPYNIKYGGVVGCNENGVTSDSYAWGPVSGGDRVGGVVGCTIDGAVIRCYATGSPIVQGISSLTLWEGGVGGITGRTSGSLPPGLGGATSNGSVDNSYYDERIIITSIDGPVITNIPNTSGPRSFADMTTVQATYVNWDISSTVSPSTVWKFTTGEFPTFQAGAKSGYYYKTVASGNWSDLATWQKATTKNGIYGATSTYPDFSNSEGIDIMAHTVTVDINVVVDQMTVNTDGVVTIPSGKSVNVINSLDYDLDNYGIITAAGTLTIDLGATFNNQKDLVINGSFFSTGETVSGPSSTIKYSGTSTQATGTAFPSSINDLIIENPAGFAFTNPTTIDGTLFVNNGTVTGGANVQGYSSPTLNFLEVAETGNLISGFTNVSSSVSANYPNRIMRQWDVYGNVPEPLTENRDKTLSFTWTAADDNNFNWTGLAPALFVNASTTGINGTFTNVGGIRTLEVNYPFPQASTNTTFRIGRNDAQTLPVELSSFTAQPHQGNSVMIQWRTQSETNVLGFSIYRGLDEDLAAALRLDISIPATNTSQAKTYVYYDREVQTGHYYYWLESIDFDGDSQLFGPVNIHLDGNDPGSPDVAPIPGFKDIYPNPFNPEATIRYGVDKAGSVDIKIYNYRGQLVRNLVDTQKSKGWHQAIWDGNNDQGIKVTSGVYFARMNMNGKQYMRKMVMMK